MEVRSNIAVVLTTCPLILSACQRAEIALDDLRPKAGQANFADSLTGAGGAAGAPSDTTEMAGSAGLDEVVEDTTPPRVLSSTPGDGERGVQSDAPILIRFSEPMNRDQTASTVALRGGLALIEWDELGTELSLLPVNGLEYARGLDPGIVKALAYSLFVGRLATDVAGNALGADYTATFYTARELSRALPQIPELMGYAIDSDNPRASAVAADPAVGDALDRRESGFISFDLSVLPSDTRAVTSATLTAKQYQVTGDPYQMGSMMLEQVSFSAAQLVLTTPTKTSFGVLFADAATETATIDVTSAVQALLAEDDSAGVLQFRFAFERASNPNGVTDEVRLLPVKLDVSYLAP
jgi:hypothetical protein